MATSDNTGPTSRVTTRQLARGSSAFTLVRVLTIGISIGLTPVVVDALGLQLYGVWALLTAAATYVGVADLGLGQALIRFISVAHAKDDLHTVRQLATVGVLAYLSLGAAFTSVAWLASHWLVGAFGVASGDTEVAAIALTLMVGYVFAAQGADVLIGLNIATGRATAAALTQSAGHIVYAVTVLVSLSLGGGLLWLVAANYIRIPITVLASHRIARTTLGPVFSADVRHAPRTFAHVWRFGGWMQVNSIAGLVMIQSDPIILGAFLGPSAVAAYDIGRKPAFAARALPLSTLPPLLPRAAKFHETDDLDRLEDLLETSTKLLAFATVALSGLLVAVSPRLLDTWIGEAVPSSSELVLLLLILGYALNNLTGTFTTFARALGQTALETRYSLLAMALNVGLSLVLTPIWGLEGLVLATVAASILSSGYLMAGFGHSTGLGVGRATRRWRRSLGLSVSVATVAGWAFCSGPGTTWFESRLGGLLAMAIAASIYAVILVAGLAVTGFPGLSSVLRRRPAARTVT